MNKETENAVYKLLDRIGMIYSVLHHEEAFTMEICEGIEKELGAPICKNLFLCNRQQTDFYLLLMPGKKVFKTKYLSSPLGLKDACQSKNLAVHACHLLEKNSSSRSCTSSPVPNETFANVLK